MDKLMIIVVLHSFQPIQVDEYILKNGLKVLIYEDHFAPVVAIQVHYRVGAYNEPLGLTGISHLLEHMAFKGTKKYGPGVYNMMIAEAGGEDNAFTSMHQTVYWTNLHKDRFGLALELEADRMQNLLLAPEEFRSEKGVVIEERRLKENDPYDTFFELLYLVSYSYHPYRNPVIGFMPDIERISRDDIYNWYKKFYNPANAVIVIAGAVDKEEALKLVDKYYGRIEGKKEKEEVFIEPPQTGERRFELKKDVMNPAVGIRFNTVPIDHPDVYGLNIIAMILASGRNSRFERILVRKRNIAANLNAFSSNSKYGGCFVLFGVPQLDVEPSTLEQEILKEIDRLKFEAISDAELNKAKNQALAQAIFRQDSVSGIGLALGWWEVLTGNWQNINRYPDEIQKVTKEDIMRIAKRYFTKDNRTVGYLLPFSESEEQ